MARELLIRELTAADRAALQFVFGRLSAESRYRRFLVVKPALTQRDLDRLLDVDHWHREAVIAWSPPPRAPIGVARYARGEVFDVAEIAVAVTDAWQRRGVGAALVQELRERAVRAGIRRFAATALSGNGGALALARRLDAHPVARHRDGIVDLEAQVA
jgi:RimJ/RimL family protein N-acetyltransferase